MIIMAISFVVLLIFKKIRKIELSIKKQLLFLFSVLTIALLFLQTLVLTNSAYNVHTDSSMSATEMSFVNKDGYVGEKNGDEFTFYQDEENLIIKDTDLNIEKDGSESLTKLDITSTTKVGYSNKISNFLSKDLFLDNMIKSNEENEEISTIYILGKTDDLKIKNME